MTDDNMNAFELIQKSDDGDFLKMIAETALQRIMDCDVDNLIGALRVGRFRVTPPLHRSRLPPPRVPGQHQRLPRAGTAKR
jgi:hypothetical protein